MTCRWPPEELDLYLSAYLDGELDLATRMDLDGWLRDHPEAQDRLGQLRAVQEAVAGLRPDPGVWAGWTVKAYRIGLSRAQPPLRRMMYLGLGQTLARPRAAGHGQGVRRLRRRRRVRLRRP